MRIVMFCHSLISDWNHGNAHFLRGVVCELLERGHPVRVYEPVDAWSVTNLVADHGEPALFAARTAYPYVRPRRYVLATLDLDEALDGADVVLVHEWNDRDLVRRIGDHRARSSRGYALLFHDTHHRAITDRRAMEAYDLSRYDGVLAFGAVLRELYERLGWGRRAWTWHEAADARVFAPRDADERDGDVVWIGTWGDDERTAELEEFFLGPVRSHALRATVYGVRYPDHARAALDASGVLYGGWLPNFRAPEVFARHAATVHVPRRPYVAALPGIPTIRVFEALACGIPLVSAPWSDAEGLFGDGDFLRARDGAEMAAHLRALACDRDHARDVAARGRATVLAHHTCAHRVDELLAIVGELGHALPEGSAVA